MMHHSLKTVAELLALRSVDSLVEGGIVWLFASLMLRIVPRKNAASRFAVWFCVLLAIAGIPLFSGVWSPGAQALAGAGNHAVLRIPDSWAVYFLVAWATLSFVFLIQIVRSLLHLQALRESCISIDPATLDPVVQETLRKHGANRRVTVCISSQVRVPAAVGLRHPVVVIPDWAVQELSADELNHVVLHELAHLRRWDDWTNLAQQVVKALFFFHPAVWWIERKASLEREIACDDAVLAETARPRAYAECLARLAEKSFAHRSLALAQDALGKVRQMSTRVAQILDADRPAPTCIIWRPAAALVAVFAIGCTVWFSRTPKLLAFEGDRASGPPAVMANASEPEWKPISSPAKLTELNFKETRRPQARTTGPRPTAVRAKASGSQVKDLIHMAGAKSLQPPITETMWIVVERDGSVADRPVLQIEMWRVTILHVPAGDSTLQIPKKI